jgi:hypothetical protein
MEPKKKQTEPVTHQGIIWGPTHKGDRAECYDCNWLADKMFGGQYVPRPNDPPKEEKEGDSK